MKKSIEHKLHFGAALSTVAFVTLFAAGCAKEPASEEPPKTKPILPMYGDKKPPLVVPPAPPPVKLDLVDLAKHQAGMIKEDSRCAIFKEESLKLGGMTSADANSLKAFPVLLRRAHTEDCLKPIK